MQMEIEGAVVRYGVTLDKPTNVPHDVCFKGAKSEVIAPEKKPRGNPQAVPRLATNNGLNESRELAIGDNVGVLSREDY